MTVHTDVLEEYRQEAREKGLSWCVRGETFIYFSCVDGVLEETEKPFPPEQRAAIGLFALQGRVVEEST